jgi:hypothetical protein
MSSGWAGHGRAVLPVENACAMLTIEAAPWRPAGGPRAECARNAAIPTQQTTRDASVSNRCRVQLKPRPDQRRPGGQVHPGLGGGA